MHKLLSRRITIALTVLFACAVSIDAQIPWAAYANHSGGLSVSMPCAPAWKETNVARAGVKAAYTSHISVCHAGDETYLVAWVDYEPSHRPQAKGELEENRDNTIKGIPGAVLLTSTLTTYQGLPALDFTASLGTRHMTSRVILQGVRPLQLAVLTPLNADRAQNISRFLTSFRVGIK